VRVTTAMYPTLDTLPATILFISGLRAWLAYPEARLRMTVIYS